MPRIINRCVSPVTIDSAIQSVRRMQNSVMIPIEVLVQE
jgi:hypothetical protein